MKMWKILCSLSLLVLLSFPEVHGYSGTQPAETQDETRGIGGFINAILGKACWCKCGKANFNVGQYRELESKEYRNGKSEDGQPIEKLSEQIQSANITARRNIVIKLGKRRITVPFIETEREDVKNLNDTANDPMEKLFGGGDVPANAFPWTAFVIVDGETYGAAIITDKHLITAAGYLVDFGATPADVTVSVGMHNSCLQDGTWGLTVSNITIHPSFDFTNARFDIAILQLTEKLTFNDTVSPICLPEAYTNVSSIRKIAWVSSWHDVIIRKARQSFLSCLPRMIRVPTMSSDECVRSNYVPGRISYEKGCLGVYGGVAQICNEDMGYPVQFVNKHGQFELLGIISYYNVCGFDIPTVYTRADQVITWIKDTISSGCFCKE